MKARLGWLRGFPDADGDAGAAALPWMTWPAPDDPEPPRRTSLDRAVVHQSTFAIKHLTGRFPRVLPALVGDPRAWAAGIGARLELLKAALHRRAALPPALELLALAGTPAAAARAVAPVARAEPALARLLAALAWIHWGDGAALERVARTVVEARDRLRVVQERVEGGRGQELALRLLDWIAADEAGARVGLDVAGDEAAWAAELDASDHLRALKTALERAGHREPPGLPAPPAGRLPAQVAALCLELGARPQARDAALAILRLVLPGPALRERWRLWWKAAAAWARQLRHAGLSAHWDRLAAELTRLDGACPPGYSWPMGKLVAQLAPLATRAPALWAALLAVLERLPESEGAQLPRLGFLEMVRQHQVYTDAGARATRTLFACVGELLRWLRALPDAAETPARAAYLVTGPFAELLERLGEGEAWTAGQLAAAFAGLRRLLPADAPWPPGVRALDGRVWQVFLSAVRAHPGADGFLRALLDRLPPRLPWARHDRGAVDAALALGGPDAPLFLTLVERLGGWRGTTVSQVATLAEQPALRPVLCELVRADQSARLAAFAERTALLAATAGARALPPAPATPPPSPAAVDRRRYPPELHEALARLAAVDPEAPRAAERILGGTFPDQARMREEVATLRRMAAAHAGQPRGERLRLRLGNLEARLARPRPPPPARLRALHAKLELRVQQATLEAHERAVEAAITRHFAGALGAPPPAAWLRDPHVQVLGALGALPAPFRKLGFRLLRGRLGPRPWDLRDDPPNAAFVQRLSRRGLDLRPWLDGLPARTRTAPDGRVLTLALEDDPLEVMRMGAPFETCLAPGAFNFFSAVANAADINKRVLYARDAGGVIMGRCLLALTGAGAILTFQAYAHDPRLGFSALVREVVLELAGAMGTTVAGEGKVDNLVAARWYDDGAVDVVGRFAFLEHGSPFRARLAQAQPAGFVAALEAELAGTLDPLTLPRVLALEELDARPALAVALGDRLTHPELPRPARLRAARLARRAGDLALAGRILAGLSRRSEWRGLASHDRHELAEELIDGGRPDRALQLLRGAAEDDEDARSRELQARAHEALGRPHQALRLYRAAIPGRHDPSYCHARIAALEAELGA